MASTINAQTTPFAAIIQEADSTGNLALQTANVTALTINSSQVVSLAQPLPVASGGTGATSNSAAPFALKGANSDITSLSGLTTALSVAQGGTGATSLSSITVGTATNATTATNASNLTGGNITGNMIVANATSPNSYYLQFGDNTGWVYRFMTNVSGTPTVRFSFQDNGAFTAVNNVTAYSDERLKKNWRSVQEGFVEKLAQVKSGIYDRIDIEATQAGASAQAMQELLPEAVQEGEDGILSIAYGNAALLAAIELAKQVVELKKEIELLKAK